MARLFAHIFSYSMKIVFLPLFSFLLLTQPRTCLAAEVETWPQGSRQLFELSQKDQAFEIADRLHASYYPTGDGKSFALVWTPQQTLPKKWIVSLPGTQGFAARDFSVWYKHIQDREVGFISLQWWLGGGNRPQDYYSPAEIYREIARLFAILHIQPNTAMLEGFSRGSSNIYAVAALDRTEGGRYFSIFVAHSGGASLNYPPTQAIDDGAFGKSPFAGSTWVTACGDKDPHPDRDGCPAMRRTAQWLKSLGADVALAIEDPTGEHGVLHRNPENAKKLLDIFLGNRLVP